MSDNAQSTNIHASRLAKLEDDMKPDRIREWLMGPMIPLATPFTEDFELDLDALRENVRFTIDHGVRMGTGSLLVGGACGEHPLLNVDERKAVMQAAMEAAAGEAKAATTAHEFQIHVFHDPSSKQLVNTGWPLMLTFVGVVFAWGMSSL